MHNRKERRRIDKQLNLKKLYKQMTPEVQSQLESRRLEEIAAIKEQRKSDLETQFNEQEIQIYSKKLLLYMEMGNTQAEAETILAIEKKRDDERSLKKRIKNESVHNI